MIGKNDQTCGWIKNLPPRTGIKTIAKNSASSKSHKNPLVINDNMRDTAE